MIRLFKEESILEVWMLRGERFELYASYPVCHWSGRLGPKLNEGDKQSPEGLYGVSYRQLHWSGHRPRSLNIGFPNALDRAFSRSGSYILVHGGCTSVGCFAMTDPVMDEIFALSEDALENDQKSIPVHIFPFRMTEENLDEHKHSEWMPFWLTLKEAHDVFERTRVPPMVRVCNRKYVVTEGTVQALMQETATSGHKRVGRTAGSYCGDNEFAGEVSDPGPGPAVRTVRRAPRMSARERYRLARIARKATHAKRMRRQATSYGRRATR
jgi:murein L,D-transpeptidase YafK